VGREWERETGVGKFISWLLCAGSAWPSEPRAVKIIAARDHRDDGEEVKVKERFGSYAYRFGTWNETARLDPQCSNSAYLWAPMAKSNGLQVAPHKMMAHDVVCRARRARGHCI
jgi:hypothetical protein